MIERMLDAVNNALDVKYRRNGIYQLGNIVISEDVHLLRFVAKWMQDCNLGPVEGFPVFLSKAGVKGSGDILIGDYDQRTHNFSVVDDEKDYFRVKLISKFNTIPATVIVYKEGWQTIKYFRPYRSSKTVAVPSKQSSQTILFPQMKEISYAEYLRSVKSEMCAIRNMGDPVAKVFVAGVSHFDEDHK